MEKRKMPGHRQSSLLANKTKVDNSYFQNGSVLRKTVFTTLK